MKRLRLLRHALLTGAAAALLALATSVHAGTLVREVFDSALLGRQVAYTAYLPDGDGPEARAPARVLYLLHGAGGDATSWLRDGALAPALARALPAAGSAPMAIVMPSLGPHTWWIDGAAEKAASALLQELMPHAESRLRVAPPAHGRPWRALAGVSMGGFGALHLALTHPARFCAVALIAPAVYDPQPPEQSAARRAAQFARDGRFDEALWRSLNHVPQLAQYARQPVRVPAWIVAGDHDPLGIAGASLRLFERLFALQPASVELRIVDGGHDEAMFDAALPDALDHAARQCR